VADRIVVEGLRARTVLGVHPHEREAPRDVLFRVTLELDLAAAAQSDDLEDTVDYDAVARLLVAHAEKARHRLVEALAGSLAALALDRFRALHAVTVRVEKPGALPGAETVAVEIRRARR
jgi:dihydroneopterin aldolase